jgi:predicted RNase H-like HicB family nuclease
VKEAIQFHLEGMKKEGYEIPLPTTTSSFLEVAI